MVDDRLSDDSLARLFARAHAGRLRFDPIERRWLLRHGKRWRVDRRGQAIEIVRTFLRRLARHFGEREAFRLGSIRCIRVVMTLAKTDRRLSARAIRH